MQKFIGLIIAILGGSYIVGATTPNFKILIACMIIGIGGIIYGDADV